MRMLYFGDFLLHGLTGNFYTGLNGDLPTNLSKLVSASRNHTSTIAGTCLDGIKRLLEKIDLLKWSVLLK